MDMRHRCAALIAALLCGTALAGDREDYNQRSAERFVAMFRAADVNGKKAITREDAVTAIELTTRFDDIDINRDGVITQEELTRFIDANFS
jgi:Ca2+-binding EF-hand superfamily protein